METRTVNATEKERQASTLAVLVLVGALESGGDCLLCVC